MDLAGKVAVVTGGGRGIGRATALALAGAGAGVCVCARTAEEIEAVADEVRRLGRPSLAVPCDVADAAQVRALADRTMATLGRADILVNNAGGGQEKSKVGADDVDRWRHTVEVNLIGLYLVTRAFLPHIIADGGGKIINIGSGMGHAPVPGNSSYAVAKAGVWMFTQVLAREVWEQGVEVNEIVPGPVATRLTAGQMRVGGPPPFDPSERVKPPAEVADLALWLATRPPGGPDRAIIQPRPPTAVAGAPTQRGTRSGSRGWRR